MIRLKVVECVRCGFRVTHDKIGLEAMASHYRNAHPEVGFNDWQHMRARQIEI